MPSPSIMHINKAVRDFQKLSEIISSPDFQDRMKHLHVSIDEGTLNQDSDLIPTLLEMRLVTQNDGCYELTRQGVLFYSRLCIDFNENVKRLEKIDGRYKPIQPIRIGKNSATYLAMHDILQRKIVLKFIRPGASDDIVSALRKISSVPDNINLVRPIDFFKINLKDIYNRDVLVDCIAFPYVDGPSLRTFLNTKDKPLSAYFIVAFIKQVGSVLTALESIDAYHGDLHEDNIIVNTNPFSQLTFNIIDLSFGLTGSADSKVCSDTDLSYFRQHLWKILTVQQSFLSRMSIRKYLGAKIYLTVSSILSQNEMTFKRIVGLLEHNPELDRFIEEKESFIKEKFGVLAPFKLLRYEEITDHQLATQVFEPFPNLMNGIKSFANTFVSGNRGSGKSTYLASVAFFPQVSEPMVNFRETFGIYFPCRQGEFRLLSRNTVEYLPAAYKRFKHLIILKIMRRTLEIISDAIDAKRIADPIDYDLMKRKIATWLRDDTIFSMDLNVVSDIRNVLSVLIRVEMRELEDLFAQRGSSSDWLPMTEKDLIDFFTTIQHSFIDLAKTRFHLLFDDAGEPNVPPEAQHIINDLIFSSNALYCVKLSAERYTYDFSTTEGKQLEEGHDFFEYDISRVLFIGTKGVGLSHEVLQGYFKRIIEHRLKHFNYKSHDIKDYLGDDPVKHEQLINSLSTGKRNTMYCGWSMIWKIADRTPRNLLHIVNEIFAGADVDNTSAPMIISNRIQNIAIRLISEKRLRSLAQISGIIQTAQYKIGVGERLYDITRSIGSVFNIYLKAERGEKRKKQYLAIERNDSDNLSDEAQRILRLLVRFGILDESKLEFARDDEMKKSIYVFNRIFCPAFGISLQRDEHLRLSRVKFEELLLDPIAFTKTGTKRLRNANIVNGIVDLFGNTYNE